MLTTAVFLPLIGSIFSGLLPKTLGKYGAVWIPTLSCIISFILSIFLLLSALSGDTYEVLLSNWIQSSLLDISWSLRLDVLSAIMIFTVSLVSSIIHLYSIGYMSNDPNQERFFSYLILYNVCLIFQYIFTLFGKNNFNNKAAKLE